METSRSSPPTASAEQFHRSEGMSSRGISSLSAKRRGADWVQVFQCRVVSCRRRRRHPTLFFIKGVCNNDFGVFRKSPEAKFRSGSLEKPPGSHIGHQKSIKKKTKIQRKLLLINLLVNLYRYIFMKFRMEQKKVSKIPFIFM